MAKVEMLCPFSGKKCKECAMYRGRHYYLCFSNNYRGHLKDSPLAEENRKYPACFADFEERLEMPARLSKKTIDPFTLPMKDIK